MAAWTAAAGSRPPEENLQQGQPEGAGRGTPERGSLTSEGEKSGRFLYDRPSALHRLLAVA
jgi:hypothetical protein